MRISAIWLVVGASLRKTDLFELSDIISHPNKQIDILCLSLTFSRFRNFTLKFFDRTFMNERRRQTRINFIIEFSSRHILVPPTKKMFCWYVPRCWGSLVYINLLMMMTTIMKKPFLVLQRSSILSNANNPSRNGILIALQSFTHSTCLLDKLELAWFMLDICHWCWMDEIFSESVQVRTHDEQFNSSF